MDLNAYQEETIGMTYFVLSLYAITIDYVQLKCVSHNVYN